MSNPAYQAARAAKSRENILNAALALFVERGYDTVGLKDIAAGARVSTATLFKHFPKKDDLLTAAITLLADMRDDSAKNDTDIPLEQALTQIGTSYARRLDHPMLLGLARLGVTLSPSIPHLGRAVNDAWRKPFAARMTALLEDAITKGTIKTPDITVSTRQFFGLMTDALLWPRLLALSGPHDAGFRQAVVTEAVKTFLSRYSV